MGPITLPQNGIVAAGTDGLFDYIEIPECVEEEIWKNREKELKDNLKNPKLTRENLSNERASQHSIKKKSHLHDIIAGCDIEQAAHALIRHATVENPGRDHLSFILYQKA
jgi:hypothetical protein